MAENNWMMIIFILVEYICGSLMFSYWLGLIVKKDLKAIGDGNPGAFNLWHAAGYKLGILGVILDFMKGYLPLVFLYESGVVNNNFLIPVALAPIFGHVFPVFHKFKGGKAIAVTFGVWSAITRFQVSLIFALILAVFQLAARIIKKGKGVSSEADGVMVVAGMILLGLYMKVLNFPGSYFIIWFFNLVVFIYANRGKLYKFYKEKTDKGIPYRY
ncbi:glycerol-3-phosphate acyltransferase [Anaerocolumna sp. AGMB13025]|uniref:glycerol-3-phosphate acyltransferase n=1 Tax=Anaerocolumna sp. AGMB13025 TaxID=3039116 RepID=UPI00241F6A77|nr:glycerol-3-phosphate acyltransferase [Anaerocolumna sp. AGMB13025]WFR59510.1 glycerol-3-phosphate acyltransferase [Anaerocolumna sp. AGMB13025]